MNWDIIEGNWTTAKGKIREQWGKLTDDELDVVAGKRDQLIGLIQQRYGKTKDAVEQEVSEYEARLADVATLRTDL
jgi:uncharacterized protein YjbJ (UPF0337 family)